MRLREQIVLAVMVVLAGVALGIVLGGGLGSFSPRITDANHQLAGMPTLQAAGATASPSLTPSATPSVRATTRSPVPDELTTTLPLTTATPEVIIAYDFAAPIVGLPQVVSDTWSAGVVDGRYRMQLNGRTSVSFTGPLPFEHYRLSVDLAVHQGGAGVIFLAEESGSIYRFLVTPDGALAIERQAATGEVVQVVPWSASPALAATPGVENHIRIERPGDGLIHFFADETPLVRFAVPPGMVQNRYGLVLTARQGQGLATFDNLRIERLP